MTNTNIKTDKPHSEKHQLSTHPYDDNRNNPTA